MATRIEFHKHGGPEVLQTVEFTPAEPAEHEIRVENSHWYQLHRHLYP